MTEPELLELLASIRTDLASAVAEVDRTTTKKPTLDASAGAYRAAGDEEPDSLRDRSTRGAIAAARRKELRTQEAEVLTAIEALRRAEVARGVHRAPLLSLLELPIARPCAARWDSLDGDGDVRSCTQCKKNVRNVVGLDPHAAAEVLASVRTAATLHRRTDGTLVADDCTVAKTRERKQSLRAFAFLGSIVVGASILILLDQPLPADAAVRARGVASSQVAIGKARARSKLDVRAPQTLSITDTHADDRSASTLGVTLTAGAEGFYAATGSCIPGGPHFENVAVPAPNVDAFVAALDDHAAAPEQAARRCNVTNDRSRSTVTLTDDRGIPTAVTTDCSRQWAIGKSPLDDGAGVTGAPHADINGAYETLLHSLPISSCAR